MWIAQPTRRRTASVRDRRRTTLGHDRDLRVLSHFYAILIVAAQWLSLGPRGLREVGVRRAALVVAAVALVAAPLVAFVLLRDSGQLGWIPRTTAGHVLFTVAMISGLNIVVFVALLIGLALSIRAWRQADALAFRLRLLGLSVNRSRASTSERRRASRLPHRIWR